MDRKWFLKSLTIWGALVAAIPPLLNLVGVTPSPEDVAALDNAVRTFADQSWAFFNQVNVFLGAVMAFVGRFRADAPVTLKP